MTFDKDAVVAEVAASAQEPVGHLPCEACGEGRVPVFADGRNSKCDTCGDLALFVQ